MVRSIGGGAADTAAGAAGELARRVGRALEYRGDLSEGDGEHVVQDEGESFGGGERLEHDQERQADRVGEQCLVLGVGALGGVDDRVWDARVQGLLAAGLARAEHVQRDARDDRGQPRAEVLDLARLGAAETQPRVLDRVVGLGERAEHPVRDHTEMRSLLLELAGEPFLLIHVTFLPCFVSYTQTRVPRAM
jgi:hypothetical protein